MRFVDTSFWVAVTTRGDAHHAQAAELVRRRQTLVTSNHVLGETWTFIRRRHGSAGAVRSLDLIQQLSKLTIVHAEAAVETEAWRWLRHHDEREYSFVDATSFMLMRSLRIRDALAFDGDFTAAGFVELRA